MTDEIWPDDAGGAYPDSALEHPFEADLYVASVLHREIVDQFHHRLRSAGVNGIEATFFQYMFYDLGNLISLAVCSVVCCEEEFEVVVLALFDQPFFEQ